MIKRSQQATELLNMIAKELGTKDKSTCINVAVRMLVDAGKHVNEAFDMIVGEGAYAKLSGDVYEMLNEKAA